jgi:phosphatidate cytidylyltransferase
MNQGDIPKVATPFPWTRILSAAVAIPLALGAIAWGGWAFTIAFSILIYLGQLEYFQLVRAKGIVPAAKTTMVVSQILLVICQINGELGDAIFPVAGTCICFYLLFQPRLATIADISTSILGLFYGGYLPSYWIRLRGLAGEGLHLGTWLDVDRGGIYVLMAFSCIWASDIGSYVMCNAIGRTRLSDISPKKTVEGAVFGLLSCVGVAVIWAWQLQWHYWCLTGGVLGIAIGVASLLGDLTESMMKRDAGVKDSGQLIPGHGGILDRADSYVFTAPLAYYFVVLFLPLLARLSSSG